VVEFALVTPLLVLLVFGIAVFGRAFFVQGTLSGAARDGVREMAIHNNIAAAKTATKAAAPGLGLTDSQISVGPSCPTSGTATVQTAVTITYQYSIPILHNLVSTIPTTINLTGKGVMQCNG
jgi:Flp pilus assembly protein TadG